MITFFFDMLYIVPLALTALYYYGGLFDVAGNSGLKAVGVILLLTVFTLFLQLKLRGRLLLTGIAVVGAAGFFLALSNTSGDPSEGAGIALIPVLLIAIVSFLTGMLMARIRVFRNVFTVALAVFVGVSLEVLPVPAGSGKLILAVFFLITVAVVNEIHLRWRRQGDTNERKTMVFTAPFILAAVLVAALFRYPDHPYDWQAFYNIWNGISVAFDRVRFNFGSVKDDVMGFSDEGEIRSSVARSGVNVLEVELQTDVYVPISFTGSVYDSFDGHRWEATDPGIDNARLMDVYESVIGARSGYEGDHRDLLRSISVDITYRNTKTKYVFVPLKTETLTTPFTRTKLSEENGVTTFEKCNPFRFEAREAFYLVNADNPAFYEYMGRKDDITESEWKEFLSFSVTNRTDNFSYENYLEYVRKVEETYKEAPEISAALREKLDAIYEGTESDYDRMKRLERALSAMTYNTDTEPVPEYVKSAGDFLDFFLLDSGEGFCTHFATAFVLLARAEGLPARYVQGYRLDTDGAGSYTVFSDAAHAWPEVYFKGKGWVRFEPTPGYKREVSWSTNVKTVERTQAPVYHPDVFGGPAEVTAPKKEKHVNVLVFIIPTAGILVFLVLFTLGVRAISRRRFLNMPEEEKLRWLCKDILSCLAFFGDRREDWETVSEFSERCKLRLGEYGPGFTKVYERILYSDFEPMQGDYDVLVSCRRGVLDRLKMHSRPLYFIKTLFSQV